MTAPLAEAVLCEEPSVHCSLREALPPGLEEVLALPGLAAPLLCLAAPRAARSVTAASPTLRSIGGPLLLEIQSQIPQQLCVIGGHGSRGQGPHEALKNALLFDPSTGWQSIDGPQLPRIDCAAAATNGFVFAIGGRRGVNEAIGSVERLDLASQKWQDMPSLRVPRYQCSATCVAGNVCVAGGVDGVELLKSVECLVTGGKITSQWE